MNQFIKNIINFTRRERRGAIVFLAIIAVLTLLLSNDVFYNKQSSWYEVKDTARINSWLQSLNVKQNITPHSFDPNHTNLEELTQMGLPSSMSMSWIKYTQAGGYFKQPQDLLHLYGMSDSIFSILRPFINIRSKKTIFKKQNKEKYQAFYEKEFKSFNPAKDSEQELLESGLPTYVVSSIMKYREAGGSFFVKSDLLKIYVINASMYKNLKPYIQLPEHQEKAVITIDSVELNSVISSELKELRFSESFIRRVLKYRELLGGYYSLDQLSEVYLVKELEVNKLKTMCWIDTLQISKIYINDIDQKHLEIHPYISHKNARKLIKYRNFANRIENFREYASLKLHSEIELANIKPYLSFK